MKQKSQYKQANKIQKNKKKLKNKKSEKKMEKIKIILLGTGGAVPTKERNMSAILMQYRGENYLFDAGENAQQQIMKSGNSFMKINNIFLSHLHADHTLGIPGLVATMSLNERTDELNIYGPKGTEKKIKQLINYAMMGKKFKINITEIQTGKIWKNEELEISAFKLKHELESYGYIIKQKDKEGIFQKEKAKKLGIPEGPLYAELQKGKKIKLNGKIIEPKQVMDYTKGEKGKKITIIADTEYQKNNSEKAKESDLLIHECSFKENEKEKAKETTHSTTKSVAKTANEAKVKKLLLYHYSARYKNEKELEDEVRKEFKNVIAGKDLMEIII